MIQYFFWILSRCLTQSVTQLNQKTSRKRIFFWCQRGCGNSRLSYRFVKGNRCHFLFITVICSAKRGKYTDTSSPRNHRWLRGLMRFLSSRIRPRPQFQFPIISSSNPTAFLTQSSHSHMTIPVSRPFRSLQMDAPHFWTNI